MKRWLPLAVIVLGGILAIVAGERQHIRTKPTGQAVLTATADAERELSRVPLQFDRLSDAEEINLGNELAATYSSRFSASGNTPENVAMEAYLQRVGLRVSLGARRRLPYVFHYIPDPHFVNAFALPGGHVFVGQGLIALMNSEDALAAVLGHEIEHIDLRHCEERTQTEAHLRHLGALGGLAGLPIEVFLVGYSKEQEMEADREGTTLAVMAQYSPAGVLQLFQEFQKLEDGPNAEGDGRPGTPVDEAAQLSLQTLAGYFRSHPPAQQRTEQIQRLMREQHWATPPLQCIRKFPHDQSVSCTA